MARTRGRKKNQKLPDFVSERFPPERRGIHVAEVATTFWEPLPRLLDFCGEKSWDPMALRGDQVGRLISREKGLDLWPRSEPPEFEPPSPQECQVLPSRARVAFAARCAQRSQPIFQRRWPGVPLEHLRALEFAISIARRYAQDEPIADAAAAARAADAAADARAAARATDEKAAATAAAKAAARAASAAAYAARATDVASAAAFAARAVNDTRTVFSIRLDFDWLMFRSRSEHWTAGTPVPSEVFPPTPPWLESPTTDADSPLLIPTSTDSAS